MFTLLVVWIQQWEEFSAQKNGLPIQRLLENVPKILIHVDASDTGWGVSSPEMQTSGYWQVRKRTLHQCSEAKDDLLCAEDAHRKIQKLDNQDPIGQHDSFKIHNKSRRYSLYRSTNISHRYTTNMQRFQLGCAVQPYTGGSEHTSRSTESIDTSPVRSGTTTPIIQHDSMPVGSSEDRRFCCKAQCKNEEVLESTSGTGCISSGRVLPEMAEERRLLASTVENDPKGNSQVSTVEDHQRSVGDALLAHPMILRMKHLTPPLLMYTNNWTLTAWHLSTKAGHAMV